MIHLMQYAVVHWISAISSSVEFVGLGCRRRCRSFRALRRPGEFSGRGDAVADDLPHDSEAHLFA